MTNMKTNSPPDEFSARFVIFFTTIAFFKQMRQRNLISRLLVSAIVSGLVVSYRQGEVTARVSLPNPIIYPAQAPLPSNYPKKTKYPPTSSKKPTHLSPSSSSKSPSSNAYSTKDTSNKLFSRIILVLVLAKVVVVGLIGWRAWKLWQASRKKKTLQLNLNFHMKVINQELIIMVRLIQYHKFKETLIVGLPLVKFQDRLLPLNGEQLIHLAHLIKL
jgi:hypothetical protein